MLVHMKGPTHRIAHCESQEQDGPLGSLAQRIRGVTLIPSVETLSRSSRWTNARHAQEEEGSGRGSGAVRLEEEEEEGRRTPSRRPIAGWFET